jgi:hypothetical protein
MTAALRVALLVAWTVLVASPGAAVEPVVYHVRSIAGVVLSRTPTTARWRKVRKGDLLLEGQLIQVTSGAAVTLEERSRRRVAGMGKDRVQLTLTKPIVARVSSDLLREVKVSTLFVAKPTFGAARAEKVENVAFSLEDAWKKLAAIVTSIPPPEPPPPDLVELERQGMALGISAKRLRLLAPVANTVVHGSDWPIDLKVVWMKPKDASKTLRFHVYAWRAGSPREAPVAETRQDFYTVKLKRAGTHFIQVTSTDGRWQSAAHAVHAMEPLARGTTNGVGRSEVIDVSDTLALLSPPDRFMAVGKAASETIFFGWDLKSAAASPEFELLVKNVDTGKEERRIKTKSRHTAIALPPGRYRWSVILSAAKLRSAERSLDVVDPSLTRTSGDRRVFLRSLIKGGKSATVVLEDGI